MGKDKSEEGLSHRDWVAHSQLGLLQIHASNRVPHQQDLLSPSSGTTAKAGFPGPAGGSRGPQIPSKIPLPPLPTTAPLPNEAQFLEL